MTMTAPSTAQKTTTFTGWHMLAIMLAFFGTIISVNCLMAYYASSSWSGILAKNTYVASQEFNLKAREAREWAREGFRGTLTHDATTLRYRLAGPMDKIARLPSALAIFHRPVGEKQDFTLVLARDTDGSFVATHTLDPGQWIIDLAAVEDGRTIFHEATRIVIPEAAK
jgi:nitrogen fixation protein FixH